MSTYVVGALGDELLVNGILLAGAGMKDAEGKANYHVVDQDTPRADLLQRFRELVQRSDIQVLFINQFVGQKLRDVVEQHKNQRPVILEVPASSERYDRENDPVLRHLRD